MSLQEEHQGCDWFSDEAACPTGTEGLPPPEEGEAGSEQNCGEEKQVPGGWETKQTQLWALCPAEQSPWKTPAKLSHWQLELQIRFTWRTWKPPCPGCPQTN